MKKIWTKDAIINEIRAMRRGGEPVNSGYVQRVRGGMMNAATTREFANWDAALSAAGLDPYKENQKRKWLDAEILTEIQMYDILGAPYGDFATIAKNHFGSLNYALALLGKNHGKMNKSRNLKTKSQYAPKKQKTIRYVRPGTNNPISTFDPSRRYERGDSFYLLSEQRTGTVSGVENKVDLGNGKFQREITVTVEDTGKTKRFYQII